MVMRTVQSDGVSVTLALDASRMAYILSRRGNPYDPYSPPGLVAGGQR